MKNCRICKLKFDENLIITNSVKRKDKIYSYFSCQECQRAIYRKDNKTERYRKYNKERMREYRDKNPLKYKARYSVRNAIVSGKLIKPDNCIECGICTQVEAHHEDYLKPLEVMWLCKACHIQKG